MIIDPDAQERVQFPNGDLAQLRRGLRRLDRGLVNRRRLILDGRRIRDRQQTEQVFQRRDKGPQGRIDLTHGITDAVEVRIFGQGRLRAGADRIHIDFAQKAPGDDELLNIVRRQLWFGERFLRRQTQVRQPVLRSRQPEQRGVHQVIAVEIGIEDQIRRVSDVRDQLPHGLA